MSSVAWTPLHAATTPDGVLVGVVALAGLGAAVLLGFGLAALARRRSQPYLLVVLALAALLARSLVAALGVAQLVPTTDHHVAEHALDVAMAALVIAAVYYARGVEERARRRLDGRTDGGRREPDGASPGRGHPDEPGGRKGDGPGNRNGDGPGNRNGDESDSGGGPR